MKKLLVIPFLAVLMLGACKKNDNSVSTLVTYSTPTITLTGQSFYSINVGGSLPSISATAYDSFYKESYPVVIDQSTLDNTVPGLNIVYVKSSNKYGMIATQGVYVAVTDISPLIDLTGNYKRVSNNAPVVVTKLANGLYQTDNVSGALSGGQTAYFVQTDDTTIVLPLQTTGFGDTYGTNAKIHMLVGDTAYQYVLNPSSTFAPSTRVFQKQ